VLAAKYKVGDQVEITCQTIPVVPDAENETRLSMEVVQFRYVREPTRDELAGAVASRAWREAGNLLKPPVRKPSDPAIPEGRSVIGTEEQRQALERARAVNLKYIANLPNFIADETATVATTDSDPPQWNPSTVIRTEVTFKGATESRDHVTQDGKPVAGGYVALGFRWIGSFGSGLKALFDPECPVTFQFQERVGHLLVYQFSSPPDNCFKSSTSGSRRFYAARTGKVSIDESNGNVMHFEESCTGFPAGFGQTQNTREVVRDYVKIGDDSHLLPVAAKSIIGANGGRLNCISSTFGNHRHFEAASNISYR
jgi:hypothetical protein